MPVRPAPSRPAPDAPDGEQEPDQVFESRGSEAGLMTQAYAMVREVWGLEHVPIHDFALGPGDRRDLEFGSGDTQNHRGLEAACEYGRAMRGKDAARQKEARRLLTLHYTHQFTTRGLDYGETLSSSHGQIIEHIDACARALAVHYKDAQILDVTGRKYRQKMYLYDLLACEGQPLGPNCRAAIKGEVSATNDLRTTVYSFLRGVTPPKRGIETGRPIIGPNFRVNAYNAPALIVEKLLARRDDFGGATTLHSNTGYVLKGMSEPPLLSGPLLVQRDTKGNMVAAFESLSRGSDVLWSAGWIDGKLWMGPYQRGVVRNERHPGEWPVLRDATTVRVEGVRA